MSERFDVEGKVTEISDEDGVVWVRSVSGGDYVFSTDVCTDLSDIVVGDQVIVDALMDGDGRDKSVKIKKIIEEVL